MILEIFIALFIFIVYFLIYVECKINKNNIIYHYDKELTRKNINNEILLKAPFHFDGAHLNFPLEMDNYKLKKKDKDNKTKEYTMIHNEILLLKPYVKSKVSHTLYCMKSNGKIDIHSNDESINYYFVRTGSADVFLIHPKFKDNFSFSKTNSNKEIHKYVENNEHFHKLDCQEGNIIFVPNYWLIYIKNSGKSQCSIEKISYSTLINKFMFYFKKNT